MRANKNSDISCDRLYLQFACHFHDALPVSCVFQWDPRSAIVYIERSLPVSRKRRASRWGRESPELDRRGALRANLLASLLPLLPPHVAVSSMRWWRWWRRDLSREGWDAVENEGEKKKKKRSRTTGRADDGDEGLDDASTSSANSDRSSSLPPSDSRVRIFRNSAFAKFEWCWPGRIGSWRTTSSTSGDERRNGAQRRTGWAHSVSR